MDTLLDEAIGGKPVKEAKEKKSFEDEALDAKVDPSVFKPEDDDTEKPKKKKKAVVEDDDEEEEKPKKKKKKEILDQVLESEADQENGWLPAYTPPYKQDKEVNEEGEGSSVVLSKYGKRYTGYDDAQTGVSSDDMADIMRSQKGKDDSVDWPLDMPEPSMSGSKKKAKVSTLSLFDEDDDEDVKPKKGKKKQSVSNKLLGAGDSYDDQADDIMSETLDKDLEKVEKKKAAKKAQLAADEEMEEEVFDEAISEIPSKKKYKSKKEKKPVKEATLLEAISEPDNL